MSLLSNINASSKSLKKVSSSIVISNKLTKAVNAFSIEYNGLVQLKVSVYKYAWRIEQAYEEEYEQNLLFANKYSKFRIFMEEKVPSFDFVDYYAYKPLIVLDKSDKLSNITNSALNYLRGKLVKLRSGEVHPDTVLVIEKLPKSKVIEVSDIMKACNDAGIGKKQKKDASSQTRSVRIEPKYTKKELNLKTKNELIDLCIKLQSALRKAKKVN